MTKKLLSEVVAPLLHCRLPSIGIAYSINCDIDQRSISLSGLDNVLLQNIIVQEKSKYSPLVTLYICWYGPHWFINVRHLGR